MKKTTPAFTLIELLISVFLLGLIVNFLYTAIGNLQKTNMMFNSKSQSHIREQKILDLLYDDIFLADNLNIEGLKNSIVSIETSNSLFDIEHPYVTWLHSKEKDTLLRFESVQDFKKMTSENNSLYHISKVAEECERFKVYLSKDENNILINIKFKDKEPLIYEFFKPLSIIKEKKDNNDTNKSKLRRPVQKTTQQ